MKCINWLKIALFLICISAPMLGMIFGEYREVSIYEKRILAEKPEFTFQLDALEELPSEYEKYINDHFGFRERLIQLYSSALVYTFETSTAPGKVIVGDDGWLFFAIPKVLDDYFGRKLFKNYELQSFQRTLNERREWLADQNIAYLFVVPPNKITVYKEFLPYRYQYLEGLDKVTYLHDHLSESSDFDDFLYLKPLLLAAKGDKQLYHKNDTHWSLAGSFLGYERMMEQIKQKLPGIDVFEYDQLEQVAGDISSDLGYMLSIPSKFREDTILYEVPNREERISYQAIENSDSIYGLFDNDEVYVTYNSNPYAKYKAVILRDSFGAALQDYLAASFQELWIVQHVDFSEAVEFIEAVKPDIVIDEVVARNLEDRLKVSKDIREYLGMKHGEAAVVNHLLSATHSLDKAVSEYADQEFIPSEEGNMIRVTGSDPRMVLDLPEGMSKGAVNIKIEIVSPAKTSLRVFYMMEDSVHFSGERLLSRELKKGLNSMGIWIDFPVRLEEIRIDVGEVSGEYVIKKLTVDEYEQ